MSASSAGWQKVHTHLVVAGLRNCMAWQRCFGNLELHSLEFLRSRTLHAILAAHVIARVELLIVECALRPAGIDD